MFFTDNIYSSGLVADLRDAVAAELQEEGHLGLTYVFAYSGGGFTGEKTLELLNLDKINISFVGEKSLECLEMLLLRCAVPPQRVQGLTGMYVLSIHKLRIRKLRIPKTHGKFSVNLETLPLQMKGMLGSNPLKC